MPHKIRKIEKLAKRSDKWKGKYCSMPRCWGHVEYVASYPHRDGTADRLYCKIHGEKFRKRWM